MARKPKPTIDILKLAMTSRDSEVTEALELQPNAEALDADLRADIEAPLPDIGDVLDGRAEVPLSEPPTPEPAVDVATTEAEATVVAKPRRASRPRPKRYPHPVSWDHLAAMLEDISDKPRVFRLNEENPEVVIEPDAARLLRGWGNDAKAEHGLASLSEGLLAVYEQMLAIHNPTFTETDEAFAAAKMLYFSPMFYAEFLKLHKGMHVFAGTDFFDLR
jgi:hypothetical protein